MKRFAMTIAGLITLSPALILSSSMMFSNVIKILIAIWLCWILTEFYIGVSRPFQGTEPKQPVLMISRMFWLLFTIYSWIDLRYHWSTAEFPSWFLTLLLALCFAGLIIRIWAIIHLGKSFSYDVKNPESGNFIKTGPYRFIRHPAYLGILILGSLPGLILGSIPGFIGMLLTTLVPVIVRAKAEDRLLEKEFGEDYIKYKQSTFGLIPFILMQDRAMERVRIHSNGFRKLFYIYHLSGGLGLIMLLIALFNNAPYSILTACGVILIAFPLMMAPPEITLNLKERRLIFRHKMKCLSVDFWDVYDINIDSGLMEVRNLMKKTVISIRQEHFKNIPLCDLKDYIKKLLSDSADINYRKYNSIKLGKYRMFGLYRKV